MAQTQVYVEDPFDRIVNVHWGGGPVVVAEVPHRFQYLSSLDPPDPADPADWNDQKLVWGGGYNENMIIPVEEYTTRPLSTTANIYMGAPIIDGIADTDLLTVGTSYKISGTGILPNTTMTYGGGGAGVLSNNGLLDIAGASVEIRLKIWELQSYGTNIHFWDGTVGSLAQAEFWTEIECGDASYFMSPTMLGRVDVTGMSDAEAQAAVDALYASFMAEGRVPAYALVESPPTLAHNGVTLLPHYSVWQFFNVVTESSDVFLINMAYGKLIQVNHLHYQIPYQPGHDGQDFVPGWLEQAGTKLTAYAPGTQFSLVADSKTVGGWPGRYYSLVVKARTGATDPETGHLIDAVPLWTARVPIMVPSPPDPDAHIEVARFNGSGLA